MVKPQNAGHGVYNRGSDVVLRVELNARVLEYLNPAQILMDKFYKV